LPYSRIDLRFLNSILEHSPYKFINKSKFKDKSLEKMNALGFNSSQKIIEIFDDYVNHLNSELFSPLGRRLHSIMSYQSLKEGSRFLTKNGKSEKSLESPVIVVGLPRSGTTNLHNLIINNFSYTGIPYWKLSCPSRVSRNRYIDRKFRRLKSYLGFYLYRYFIPSIQSMHTVDLDTYEECWHFQKNLFLCYNYVIQLKLMKLEEFLLKMDTSALLNIYKEFILSTSQSSSFALKCPDHLMFLDDISKVFPDARIVWIHRNPFNAISSYCPMIYSAWELFFKDVSKKDVGDFIVDLYHRMITKASKDRDSIRNKIIDVQYSDLIKNPKEVSELLSCQLQKDIILNNSPNRKSTKFFKNKFKFDANEYELDEIAINEKFSFYRNRFIKDEKKI
tara:strand:- start:5317 stop:6492 length:1176 start_codon:yes stop_codon:yes gene_type:complete